jgi:transcriptional regulator of acetoin/glycerol metabolism
VSSSDQLFVAVVGEGSVTTVPLPERGKVGIGRAETNQIRLDDPMSSRNHAVLRVEDGVVELEDLGAMNGTIVSGRLLPPKARVAMGAGQVIEIGATMLIIQSRALRPRARRVCPHGYFELRLEEACVTRSPAAVVWISAPAVDPADVERELLLVLGPADLAARYATHEWELFLAGAGDQRADQVIEQLLDRLGADIGAPINAGAAVFPGDGRTADAMLAAAKNRAHPFPAHDEGPTIARDPAMIDLLRALDKTARTDAGLLLIGEPGTGKEMIARELHQRSPRSGRPFSKIACAALPESLSKSELVELLESAGGGTIFLDEPFDLSPNVQALLVSETKPIDVRFVSASDRDLDQETRNGRFRQDLYFRLASVTLVVPPLRERRDEIRPLVEAFLRRAAEELALETASITSPAVDFLEAHDWPGNVRELRNVIERALLLAGGAPITPQHLPLEKLQSAPGDAALPRQLFSPHEELARIARVLEACGHHRPRAARMLGVSRRTLAQKIERYDLARPGD